MDPTIDERRFRELQDESDDLQSGAMRTARTELNAYVDAATQARHEAQRSHGGGGALLSAGALGAGALAFASPALAASSKDVMVLQTAAGLENLAVDTYRRALGLPFVGGRSANRVVNSFARKTMAQHADHAKAFNSAARRLGGTAQTGTDPKFTPIVTAAVRKIRRVGDVVSLAITLEDLAAQTYVRDVGLVSTSELRKLFASVAGVEAQHRAILLAVRSLLTANAPGPITLPPDAAQLPAALGEVGFPTSFYPTALAAPAAQGRRK